MNKCPKSAQVRGDGGKVQDRSLVRNVAHRGARVMAFLAKPMHAVRNMLFPKVSQKQAVPLSKMPADSHTHPT